MRAQVNVARIRELEARVRHDVIAFTMAAAATRGTWPASASVSVAANSTSSHLWNLFSSLQTRPISSRVYREINQGSFPAGSLRAAMRVAVHSQTLAMRAFLPNGGEIPYAIIPEVTRFLGRKHADSRLDSPGSLGMRTF